MISSLEQQRRQEAAAKRRRRHIRELEIATPIGIAFWFWLAWFLFHR